MSILSRFLNKKLNIPETKIAKTELGQIFFKDIYKYGTKELTKNLTLEDLLVLIKLLKMEVDSRFRENNDSSAGIGKGH